MCVFLLYWCVCTPSSRSFPPATSPASAIEHEFRAGSMIQMKCTLVRNLPLNSSILVEKSSRLKVFGLHEPRSILHLHLCRFQTLSWNFYGKSNATNPHTWILLPVDFGTFFSILEVWYSNALLSLLLFHIHHGVEVDILEDGCFKGMFSALPASRNCIPDSVLSKDLSVCVIGLRSRMYWHRIAAAAAAAAAAFWGGRGFSRSVEATVSRCTPEGLTFVSTFFRILCTLLVIFHGRLWRLQTHIIEVLFQWWTVIHQNSCVTLWST